MWCKCLANNVWKDFILTISGSGMVIKNARSSNQVFAVNFELKFCRARIANADIGSLKCILTFF